MISRRVIIGVLVLAGVLAVFLLIRASTTTEFLEHNQNEDIFDVIDTLE